MPGTFVPRYSNTSPGVKLNLPQLNVFSGEFLRNAKLEVVHCEDIDDIDSPTKKQEDDFSDAEV
ncbi:hypothetical protein ACF0H5_003259 [Mactra antiquata]